MDLMRALNLLRVMNFPLDSWKGGSPGDHRPIVFSVLVRWDHAVTGQRHRSSVWKTVRTSCVPLLAFGDLRKMDTESEVDLTSPMSKVENGSNW